MTERGNQNTGDKGKMEIMGRDLTGKRTGSSIQRKKEG